MYLTLPKVHAVVGVDWDVEGKAIQSTVLSIPRAKSTATKTTTTTTSAATSHTTLKLPTPVFVLGYPKSGTTSIYGFFNCSGIVSQHFCCCGDRSDHPPCKKGTMARCILRNMGKNRPLLEGCGDYDVYAQLDGERPIFPLRDGQKGVLLENGTLEMHSTTTRGNSLLMRHFLPQHFHLDKIHQHAPHATYILSLRDPNEWAKSAFKWFNMRGMWTVCIPNSRNVSRKTSHTPTLFVHIYSFRLLLHTTGRFVNEYMFHNSSIERPGKARALDFLARIYREHNDFVRDFVRQHPTHTLIEVNITALDAGNKLAEAFGLDEQCWGHHNKLGNRTKS